MPIKTNALVIMLCIPTLNAFAYEKSECDGLSSWKKSPNDSADVLTRTCNVFGMNYIEIKSQLNENRCIVVKNTKTGDHWKFFFLRKQSIKSLGSPHFDPKNFEVSSRSIKDDRCSS